MLERRNTTTKVDRRLPTLGIFWRYLTDNTNERCSDVVALGDGPTTSDRQRLKEACSHLRPYTLRYTLQY